MELYNKKKKVSIDKSWFGKMLEDTWFNALSTEVDRKGKKVNKEAAKNELKKYYISEEVEEKEEENAKPSIIGKDGEFVWNEVSSEEPESDADPLKHENLDDLPLEEEIDWSENSEDIPWTTETGKRLAV